MNNDNTQSPWSHEIIMKILQFSSLASLAACAFADTK